MREADLDAAVTAFWDARIVGTQSAGHPKAFIDLIVRDLKAHGWGTVGDLSRNTVLGGYFRPAKAWDIVCWSRGKPRVAVEFKSQVGSYGNNENNRYEEALGSALDLRAKYGREIALGFVFVICDEEKSRTVTRQRIPGTDPAFLKSSHVDRRSIFASRIVDYKVAGWPLYDAAAVLMITRDGGHHHPTDPRIRLLTFAQSLTMGREPS